MECLSEKEDDGVPNLLKMFEKAKLEEEVYTPAMLSAIQRLPSEVKVYSGLSEGENLFLVDDKDEEELAMILSNSGNPGAQSMENVIDDLRNEGICTQLLDSGGNVGSTVNFENQRTSHRIIRRPCPAKSDERNDDVQRINPKGLLSQLRSDELCTFLAAALTSAAAVRKLPKSTSSGLPLPCRTNFSDNNNNDSTYQPIGGSWCASSPDFRSPPCKRVKLHNRPCLDFEKMHKQKACSSFQSGRSISNWKSTTAGNLLHQKNQTTNYKNNVWNNSTWGLVKLDPTSTSCTRGRMTPSTNGDSLSVPDVASTYPSYSQLEAGDHDDSSVSNTPCNQSEAAYVTSPPTLLAFREDKEKTPSPCVLVATKTKSPQNSGGFVSADISNGIGRISKHHSNANTRGAVRYNYLQHNSNNKTPIFGPTWHHSHNQQLLCKDAFPEDRAVPHRRTKHSAPHHLKVISNSSNLDLRHLNSVIGGAGGSSGGGQSFVPICFPTTAIPSSQGASPLQVQPSLDTAVDVGVGMSPNCNSSLFAVGSNFRSLCTAGTQ